MGMHKTGKYCPLDGTEIYTNLEYGGSEVMCSTCGTDYKTVIDSPEEIIERAKARANSIPSEIEEINEKLELITRGRGKLEALLENARKKGLVEKV